MEWHLLADIAATGHGLSTGKHTQNHTHREKRWIESWARCIIWTGKSIRAEISMQQLTINVFLFLFVNGCSCWSRVRWDKCADRKSVCAVSDTAVYAAFCFNDGPRGWMLSIIHARATDSSGPVCSPFPSHSFSVQRPLLIDCSHQSWDKSRLVDQEMEIQQRKKSPIQHIFIPSAHTHHPN